MLLNKRLLVTFGMMAGLATGLQAQFAYKINSDLTITITGYTGPGGAVTIPPTLDGLLVTSIGSNAFLSVSSTLTSVSLPYSLTSIGDNAFNACGSLTNLTIPNGVTSIGGSAFTGSGLISITIPNSVTNLGAGAFWNCGSLTSVKIPTGVTFIVDGTFYECVKLASVSIPNSVNTIGSFAFYNCTSLGIITIPNSVTVIGDGAFAACTNLSGVYFMGTAPSLGGGGSSLFSGADYSVIYYRPGAAGWGTTFAGRPALPCNPHVQNGSAGLRGGQFGFSVTGSYGLRIVVEASANPANPVWVPMATNAMGFGSYYFSDPTSMQYPRRFYRLRSP